MSELVTVGETMAAFAPRAAGPLRYCPEFRLSMAGAESNTAVGLCKLGHTAAWFGRLGTDELGESVLSAIRAEGVDTSRVLRDPAHRTGLMIKQLGRGETTVYYYRENSAASFLSPDDLSDDLLSGARILHLTGITSALRASCAEAATALAARAKRAGVKISFDPNIRRKLWGETDFRPVLRPLLLGADIALLGLDEARALLDTDDPLRMADLLLGAGVEAVAVKNGAAGGWVADARGCRPFAPAPCHPIDPVGAGDAFNAGFLAGLLEEKPTDECARMGAVAGAMATETTGDIEGLPGRAALDARLTGIQPVTR